MLLATGAKFQWAFKDLTERAVLVADFGNLLDFQKEL